MTACQRWQDRKPSWRPTSEGGFDPDRYGVAAIGDDTTAAAFVEQHHYSGSYPNAKWRYGLYDLAAAAELVGVAVFSIPTANAVLTKPLPGLDANHESIELGRFILLQDVPANAESYFLGQAFRLIAGEGVRGVVSFSDPVPRFDSDGKITMPGHLGIIYQATNATYHATSTARTEHVLPDGTVFSGKNEQKIRDQDQGHRYAEQILIGWGARPMRAGERPAAWLAQALAAAGARNVRHPGKHRYVFRVGTRAQRRAVTLGMPSLPYPKAPAALFDLVA